MPFNRLNMLSKMFLVPFLCIISSGLLSAAIMSCKTDGDCPANHYCYSMTNVCAECISNFCSRYNRKESSWKKCHTEPSDCGSCLPGYEVEYFSDGSTRASCILSQHPTPSQYSGFQKSPEGFSPTYLFGLMGISMVALLGFFMYNAVRRPTVHIIRPEERELRPINNPCNNESLNSSDVYEPSAPILPGYSRVDPFTTCGNDSCENEGNAEDCCRSQIGVKQPLECCEYTFEIKQPATCRLVESAIFRRPDYEDENLENVANAQDNEDDEEDPESQEAEEDTNRGNLLIPPVHYHDESTLPSTWTPEPLQAEIENTSLSVACNPETAKRPSTEMGSSESEDEQNPKRACNNGNEEEDGTPSTGLFRNFRLIFTRQNQNTSSNNSQNRNPENPTKDK